MPSRSFDAQDAAPAPAVAVANPEPGIVAVPFRKERPAHRYLGTVRSRVVATRVALPAQIATVVVASLLLPLLLSAAATVALRPAPDDEPRLLVRAGRIPGPDVFGTAVWDGSGLLYLGTRAEFAGSRFLRFTPGTPLAEPTEARFDPPLIGPASVWTRELVLLYGGELSGRTTDAIHAYDPRADRISRLDERLPTPVSGGSAVWTGAVTYLVGGLRGVKTPDPNQRDVICPVDSIARHDPWTGEVSLLKARIPVPVDGAAAIWHNGSVLLLGGTDLRREAVSHIQRFHVATGIATIAGSLPYALAEVALAWDGRYAYFGGGVAPEGADGRILRFDPATGALTDTGHSLPGPRGYTAAFWAGSKAYVLGGLTRVTRDPYTETYTDEIVAYDPVAGTATVVAHLPTTREGLTVAFDGTRAFVFGGHSVEKAIPTFDPTTGAMGTSDVELPTERWGAAAVWAGDAAFVFGGTSGGPPLKEILKFTPTRPPTAARDLAATRGPGAGEISLAWTAPEGDGGAPITGYEVHRGDASGEEALHATLGNVLIYTDAGLANGATRFYKVRAKNAVGAGPFSNGASATTFDVPGAPLSFTVTPGPGAGEFTLAWDPPASDGGTPVTGYRVRWGTSSGDLTESVDVGNVATWSHTGLGNGVTRFYTVSALNLVGEGTATSDETGTTAVPPSAPRALTASNQLPDVERIHLAWDPPLDDGGLPLTGYEITREDVVTHATETWQTGTGTTHVDLPATFGAYKYVVKAINPAGTGPASNHACAVGGQLAGESTEEITKKRAEGCLGV